MTPYDFESISTDKLWAFHEQVRLTLSAKIVDRKREIERRFYLVNWTAGLWATDEPKMNGGRQHYPRVFPKYRNPLQLSETWAGRGKQPRWLTAQLGSGKQLDDFLIERAAA
jgi:DNA-binding protein H-NS